MAKWSYKNITLTTMGASMLSRVEMGDGSLTITRVIASEQRVNEADLENVTGFSVENMQLIITDRREVENGGSVIQVQLNNLELAEEFVLNEIGVFATHSSDPTKEFLYIIAQVDDGTGDEIPVYATTPVTATYDIYLYNVNAAEINVTISASGLVTYEYLNDVCRLLRRKYPYKVGEIQYDIRLPSNWYFKCVEAGITGKDEIVVSKLKLHERIKDGTVVWLVCRNVTTDGDKFYRDDDGNITLNGFMCYSDGIDFELKADGGVVLAPKRFSSNKWIRQLDGGYTLVPPTEEEPVDADPFDGGDMPTATDEDIDSLFV